MQTLKRRNKKTNPAVYRKAFKTLLAGVSDGDKIKIKNPLYVGKVKDDFAKSVITLAEQDE